MNARPVLKILGLVKPLSKALFCWLMLASAAYAQAPGDSQNKAADLSSASSPHQVVEQVTVDLMKIVSNGKQALASDPKAYYTNVRSILEAVVDFDYIARNVMGSKYWKDATPEQRVRFVDVFTAGMVRTYAKGMANFAEYDISVVPPDGEITERRAEVVQKFKGPEGVGRVAYTMGHNKAGEWKLINVTLDGVNLGKTLRTQFAQAVSENKGNITAAIDGWAQQS